MHFIYDGGSLVVWDRPSVCRSSATCVADDVKEGGLGLGFSEPESPAPRRSLQLSLSSCGHLALVSVLC